MHDHGLTAEPLAEAERLEDVWMTTLRAEMRGIVRESARRENGELLGEFEFDIRAALHRAGTAMLAGRKRGVPRIFGRLPRVSATDAIREVRRAGRHESVRQGLARADLRPRMWL